MRTSSTADSPAATNDFSAVTADLIAAYGVTVKNLVEVYRVGGERMAELIDQRWSDALARARDPLTAEARRNVKLAHDVAGSLYHRGLALSSAGAEAVVDKVVEMARQGVAQAASNAARFDESLGVPALDKLAQVAAPVAVAATVLANHIEATSGEWVQHMAGETATRPAMKRATRFSKVRARGAA